MSKAGSTKDQMLCLAKALHAVSVLHILFNHLFRYITLKGYYDVPSQDGEAIG